MKKRRGTVLMTVGLLLLAAALSLTAYNVAEDRRAQKTVTQTLTAIEAMIPSSPTDTTVTPDAAVPEREMPEREVDGQWYIGKLELPSLGITLPIMSEWSYKNLKHAPCRYSGSVYRGDLILAAHNYSSHFGRLKELPLGADVVFTDMNGQQFFYTVTQAETLAKTAIEDMEAGEWDLTLFTCTLSGESRFTLRCTQVTPTE